MVIAMVHEEWLQPPTDLSLMSNDVHIWRATLDIPSARVKMYECTLTYDELKRAAQFRFPHHCHRFIIGRGILRAILGNYLSVEPEAIRFSYTHYGKPHLVYHEGQTLVQFNVTHSEGVALYIVSQARAVGIDMEFHRQVPDLTAIAKRFFSPSENRMLHDLPPSEWSWAFLRCWTRKEAYSKARGMGLTLPFNQYSVTLAPNEPARLLSTDNNPIVEWSLHDITLEPQYAAAFAVEGTDYRLRCWQWLD